MPARERRLTLVLNNPRFNYLRSCDARCHETSRHI